MEISRRKFFLSGSATSFASLQKPHIFKEQEQGDIFIVVFASGGLDGLHFVAPAEDSNYRKARPTLALKMQGGNAALKLKNTMPGTNFYMNAHGKELYELYNQGDLSIIHATGSPVTSTSHFDAALTIMGSRHGAHAPDPNSWFHRHLESFSTEKRKPSVGLSSNRIKNLVSGSFDTVDLTNDDAIKRKLRNLTKEYKREDEENTFPYTKGPLSRSLRNLASLINNNSGLKAAVIDHNGWDHHNNLASGFTQQMKELSKSLFAFWHDVRHHKKRINLVVMTEFGRQVYENKSIGTDHGAASVITVLSGNTNGGVIYGKWPGLQADALMSGGLKVTTDYRTVISEILIKRFHSYSAQSIFPTLKYQPLNFMNHKETMAI